MRGHFFRLRLHDWQPSFVRPVERLVLLGLGGSSIPNWAKERCGRGESERSGLSSSLETDLCRLAGPCYCSSRVGGISGEGGARELYAIRARRLCTLAARTAERAFQLLHTK